MYQNPPPPYRNQAPSSYGGGSQQPANQYPAQQQSYYAQPASVTSNNAIASLVFGIVSMFICPGLAAPVAILLGYSAKREIKASNGRVSGQGMASAGIILGYISITIVILAIIITVLFFLLTTGSLAALFALFSNPSRGF